MAGKKQGKGSKVQVKLRSSGGLNQIALFGDDLVTADLKYEKGEKRDYVVTEPTKLVQDARSHKSIGENILLAVLLLASLAGRLYMLSQPSSVVFDEVHFGGFARKYILGTFFMDVHPPLAKMLFGGVGFLFGYNGDFPFTTIGDEFPETVPYVMMRAFSALCGVGTIFTLYSTLRLSGCKPSVSLFTSALLLIENANFTISRYILLDSPLIFFISCAAYSLKRSELDTPFTFSWYKSLLATGVAMGLSLSSKWVGLFTVAWVGLVTIWDLWFLLGDVSVKPVTIVKQIAAKLFFFLVTPITLYLYFFSVHFQVLDKEGDGATFMSAPFRSTLIGNNLPKNILADVGVGSRVTIRHLNTQGGYLHSHNHLYETGSKQQQVTLYPHLDMNNIFEIALYNVSEKAPFFVPIPDGTKIRLMHEFTKRRLHSHDEKAPVSESADWQKEVSCYGFDGFEGDPNDDFIVEIVKSKSKPGDAQRRLRSLETVFRLRHAMTGCYLFSHEVKLPDWGFQQQEVTCATQGIAPLTYWYIESNESEFLPEDLERVSYTPPSFWSKVVESHKVMWKINQGLTDSHHWQSTPESWPFLTRGINYWVKNNTQIYLFGNVITWYAVTLSIIVFGLYVLLQLFRWQRGYQIATSPEVFNFNVQAFHFIVGWGVHYAPSFLMGRQLFLHHYLPLFYFGLLALGHFFEVLHSYIFKNKKMVSYFVMGLFFSAAVSSFYKYSPLIKGDIWTKGDCESSKLMDSWDFDCNAFLDSPSAYESVTKKVEEPIQTSSIDFHEAILVPQIQNFGQPEAVQQPIGKLDVPVEAPIVPEEKVPESEEVEFDTPVEVDATPADENPVAPSSEESTVGEPAIEQLETPSFDEEQMAAHQELLEMLNTEPSPEQMKPVRDRVVMIKDGKYIDSDGNDLSPEQIEKAKEFERNFPMDKLTKRN